jgi:outer membrane protein assembly factor BamB
MCGTSRVGGVDKVWCGTGWTGQPVIWQRPDGIKEAIVGTYDKMVHFINLDTGEKSRDPYPTNDIIKGSVTLDPDGFPLLYFGSRDNYFRILSLQDPKKAVLLKKIEGNTADRIWNNDWDSNSSIVNDVLYVGGENSWFYAILLNRHYDLDQRVQVSPVGVRVKGWSHNILAKVGDRNTSIESSPAIFEDNVYFTNSSGRIVGLSISKLREYIDEIQILGDTPEVYQRIVREHGAYIKNIFLAPSFEFWAGDDIDASIVIDEEGMLYVGVESERKNEVCLIRKKEVGQFIKLNPKLSNPLVWKLDIKDDCGVETDSRDYGIWSTAAVSEKFVFITTHLGLLLSLDRFSGEILDQKNIGFHAWSSPIKIDEKLYITKCTGNGNVLSFDILRNGKILENELFFSDVVLKNKNPKGCVESTPAVIDGQFIFGSRDGYIYSYK